LCKHWWEASQTCGHLLITSAFLARYRSLQMLCRRIACPFGRRSQCKHREWNSRVNSPREVLLRDFATANSCFVHGPDVPTTVPSCPIHTPDVPNIVVVKDFLLPVNQTVCSALSSDHFPVIVDIYCQSSIQTMPERPCFE